MNHHAVVFATINHESKRKQVVCKKHAKKDELLLFMQEVGSSEREMISVPNSFTKNNQISVFNDHIVVMNLLCGLDVCKYAGYMLHRSQSTNFNTYNKNMKRLTIYELLK